MTSSPLDRFLSLSSEGPIFLDGGIGTLLMSRNDSADAPAPRPSFWHNLTEPDNVVAVHLRFLKAGAELLLVNSFCASRLYLDAGTSTTTVGDINQLAVKLARAAISKQGHRDRLVAGSIGPLLPGIPDAFQHELFFEQAMALATADVDLLVCETFLDCEQLARAAEACREVASRLGRIIPVVGSLVPQKRESAGDLVRLRQDRLVNLIGLNCGTDFDLCVDSLEALNHQTAGPFWFKPSCGSPSTRNGVTEYPISPQRFAKKMAELSKRVPLSAIGGCCGASPEHIESLRKHLSVDSGRVSH